jgi:hypothetical protein
MSTCSRLIRVDEKSLPVATPDRLSYDAPFPTEARHASWPRLRRLKAGLHFDILVNEAREGYSVSNARLAENTTAEKPRRQTAKLGNFMPFSRYQSSILPLISESTTGFSLTDEWKTSVQSTYKR